MRFLMTQTNNQISAKEALRLLNYWQNTKWEIDKQEQELSKVKQRYIEGYDSYIEVCSHVVYGEPKDLTVQDYLEAFEDAQSHINIFYKSKNLTTEELTSLLPDSKITITEDYTYDSFYGKKCHQTYINISILKPKSDEFHNQEIKDLENHIDNLKEKYENIKEELKQMNVIIT